MQSHEEMFRALLCKSMGEFKIGDKVYHPDFGEGVIRSIALSGYLCISFPRMSDKQYFYPEGRYCKEGEITLRKLEKEDE